MKCYYCEECGFKLSDFHVNVIGVNLSEDGKIRCATCGLHHTIQDVTEIHFMQKANERRNGTLLIGKRSVLNA